MKQYARHIFLVIGVLVMVLAVAAWWRSGASVDYMFYTWRGGSIGAGSCRGMLVLSLATHAAPQTHLAGEELGFSHLALADDGGPIVDPVPPDMNLHARFGYSSTPATDAATSWRFVAMPWWFVTLLPACALTLAFVRVPRIRASARRRDDAYSCHGQLANA